MTNFVLVPNEPAFNYVPLRPTLYNADKKPVIPFQPLNEQYPSWIKRNDSEDEERQHLGKRSPIVIDLTIPETLDISKPKAKRNPRLDKVETRIIDHRAEAATKLTKKKRTYRYDDFGNNDLEPDQVLKNPKHITAYDNIKKVLEFFYRCDQWTNAMGKTLKSAVDEECFINYIIPAIFDKEVKPDECRYVLQNESPKSKRRDEFQKKVLSKIAWRTKDIEIEVNGNIMPLSLYVYKHEIAKSKKKDQATQSQILKGLRRVFGKFYDRCTYRELKEEMKAMIQKEDKTQHHQVIERAFQDFNLNEKDNYREVSLKVLQKIQDMTDIAEATKKYVSDITRTAAENLVSSLVKEGLHNEGVKMILNSEVIMKHLINSNFLNEILKALDEQTLSDVDTNFMSKLKKYYYDIENDISEREITQHLVKCFKTKKFSKHPMTYIQNAQAILDFLHKLQYRSGQERIANGNHIEIRQKIVCLMKEYTEVVKNRENLKNR